MSEQARVAVVTDSTAYLPAELSRGSGVEVVPLQVVIAGTSYDEVDQASSGTVADALRHWQPVTTSRPGPAAFLAAYQRAADRGCDAVVSVHLSAQMSGTVESARLAAKESPVPAEVVDSETLGMALGFAVLSAAAAAAEGRPAHEVAEAARRRAAASTAVFYVDTLEHLRRGGRIGAAAALVGSALAVKPILRIDDGRVTPYERVRTAGKALSRLEELAVDAAGSAPVDVAVAHLASPERGATLAERLGERLAVGLEGRPVHLGEIGAVLGAHVGPGMVAVVVAGR